MSTLAELNAAVQAAPGANAQVKAWIGAATQLLEPAPPPTSSTRACFVTNTAGNLTDAGLLALLPTIKAASYNTVKFPAEWPQSLAWCAANGMSAWLSLGYLSSSDEWSISDAQAVSDAGAAAAILPISRITWFLTDEPAVGDLTAAKMVLARAELLKEQVPGSRSMIDYFDADSVKNYTGLDLIAADLYVNKFGYNWSLVTQLGQACTAAGLDFTTTIPIASDTLPYPSAAEVSTWYSTGKAAGSQGFAVYEWGLGAEQAWAVQAVQALP